MNNGPGAHTACVSDFYDEIDLVYLWFDPSDTVVQNNKKIWLDKIGIAPEANEKIRWIENDELRYSLRSVEKFAPWIRHIYIITSFGQIPKWLDTANPKITIINDKDIMPVDAIPTFNSNAIESCIANIPGLSEHFLLSNDDMFFGRSTGPDYFFNKSGNPIVWYTRNKRFGGNYDAWMERVGLWRQHHISMFKLMERAFGVKLHKFMPSHNIEAYRKSHIIAAKNHPMLRDEINQTTLNRFRTSFDIPRFVYTMYGYVHGNVEMRRIYAPKSWRHPVYNLFHWLRGDFSRCPQYHESLDRLPHDRTPSLFCINKSQTNEFAKIFPTKSGLER